MEPETVARTAGGRVMRFAERTGLKPWRCRYCSDPIVVEPGGKTYSAHDGSRHDQLICRPYGFFEALKQRRQSYCRNCELIVRGDVLLHRCERGEQVGSVSQPVIASPTVSYSNQKPAVNDIVTIDSPTPDPTRIIISRQELFAP